VETCQLIEAGFEFVCDFGAKKFSESAGETAQNGRGGILLLIPQGDKILRDKFQIRSSFFRPILLIVSHRSSHNDGKDNGQSDGEYAFA
jgi:hypothetical protein